MRFGEIFTGAFTRIWHHKKLWLLAMVGLALSGLGMLINSLLSARWLGSYFEWLNSVMRNPTYLNGMGVMRSFMDSMVWIWAAVALSGLLSLVGYVLNLVARGAIITEANYAWRDRRTDAGRGLRHGLNRAAHVFLIDLVWWLPALVLIVVGVVVFFLLVAFSAANSGARELNGVLAGAWLLFLCSAPCVFLLYGLFQAIFAPLMYQSAVAGERGVGAAISEGWTLARRNLGAMVILWLLLFLVSLVLGAVLQSFSAVASFPLIRSWTTFMTDMMSGLQRGTLPQFPTVSWPWFGLLAIVSSIVWFLVTSFTQALSLTVYAGAYQHLTGATPLGAETVTPAEPLPPAPVVPVVPVEAPVVPPAEPTERDVPPTL